VSYGRGGELLTVTDANLVLGYLNPAEIAGGSQKLDRDGALEAANSQAAEPLGLSVLEASYGIYRLVNSNMSRALRAASVERGRDPREYSMVAFGGAGPMHAAALAQSFGIGKVIIPPMPGLLSALGLLVAETRHDHVLPCPHPTAQEGWADANRRFDDLQKRALAAILADGIAESAVTCSRLLDLRYRGQTLTLTIPLEPRDGSLDDATFRGAVDRFETEYQTTFGHSLGQENVQLVGLRVRASGTDGSAFENVLALAGRDGGGGVESRRQAYFGEQHGELDTPVLQRHDVPAELVPGPMIVEGDDSTIVVPPTCRVRRDDVGNILIDTSAE
jgi:N-methylhydantoinase A